MVRPEVFQQPYIALQNIPYVCGADSSRNHAAGGVLSRGQTVWTKEAELARTDKNNIIGFVEGVGVITISPRALIRADVLNERRA